MSEFVRRLCGGLPGRRALSMSAQTTSSSSYNPAKSFPASSATAFHDLSHRLVSEMFQKQRALWDEIDDLNTKKFQRNGFTHLEDDKLKQQYAEIEALTHDFTFFTTGPAAKDEDFDIVDAMIDMEFGEDKITEIVEVEQTSPESASEPIQAKPAKAVAEKAKLGKRKSKSEGDDDEEEVESQEQVVVSGSPVRKTTAYSMKTMKMLAGVAASSKPKKMRKSRGVEKAYDGLYDFTY